MRSALVVDLRASGRPCGILSAAVCSWFREHEMASMRTRGLLAMVVARDASIDLVGVRRASRTHVQETTGGIFM